MRCWQCVHTDIPANKSLSLYRYIPEGMKKRRTDEKRLMQPT
jgi:hypothetical protein